MFHIFVEWISLSSIEWLYISFCAFGLGMLVGVGICAYRQIYKEHEQLSASQGEAEQETGS